MKRKRKSSRERNTCCIKIRRTGKKKENETLKQLLDLNEEISKVMILKEKLKKIWSYTYRGWAEKRIDEFIEIASESKHKCVRDFCSRLKKYKYGILNHCDYPIHTSKLEGTNNKIKVIKREAYGFHDPEYFKLKVYQATSKDESDQDNCR